MSNTFWIDDLTDFGEILPMLNQRLEIDPKGDYFTEESAKVRLEDNKLFIDAEKSTGKNGADKYVTFTLEYNLEYQTIDEVIYGLKKLLGFPV